MLRSGSTKHLTPSKSGPMQQHWHHKHKDTEDKHEDEEDEEDEEDGKHEVDEKKIQEKRRNVDYRKKIKQKNMSSCQVRDIESRTWVLPKWGPLQTSPHRPSTWSFQDFTANLSHLELQTVQITTNWISHSALCMLESSNLSCFLPVDSIINGCKWQGSRKRAWKFLRWRMSKWHVFWIWTVFYRLLSLLSTATVATVHKPRDSSELSHGHIAVTGSPACSVRKFDPKLPKRPKLSARNVVRLTATNCALLPRLQPADHLRPFLPFKRHELQTISSHSTLSGGNLWVRGSRQSAVRDIQAANSKKRHKSVEKIQISVINNDTHNKNK